MQLSETAKKVLEARYLHKDESGKLLETPDSMLRRVARAIAAPEKTKEARKLWEDTFYDIMDRQLFLPNSPTLMNAGRNKHMTLSACFVLPIDDSIEGIFKAVKDTAVVQKAGGGTGYSFDKLRPTGDYIASSGGKTSGPIAFWGVLSETTKAIQQGAFRRGANMGMMSIWHPDILKFITAKNKGEFSNYNISVKITDEWMKMLEESPKCPIIVANPRTGVCYAIPKTVDTRTYAVQDLLETGHKCKMPNASLDDMYEDTADGIESEGEDTTYKGRSVWTLVEFWNLLVDSAWKTGDPGMCFIDIVNKDNKTPHIGYIEACNPCGEQPLLANEACNLGSINLSAFVKEYGHDDKGFDKRELRKITKIAVRFLDNVIDAQVFPTAEIDALSKSNRKIGVGIMGWADMLFKLGIPYGSRESFNLVRTVMKEIKSASHEASAELAEEKGVFPNYADSEWDKAKKKMRNAAVTTVAPTGSISIIAGCSCGIEPIFSLAFKRNIVKEADLGPMIEVNPVFVEALYREGYEANKVKAICEDAAEHGSIQDLDINRSIKDVFICAHDIDSNIHVEMQGAFQEYIDSAVSKTINLTAEATREDVSNIYKYAFSQKCKGITVYRDGCHDEQPMELKKKVKKPDLIADPVPEITPQVKIRQRTPFGTMHIKVTVDPELDTELEIFASLGKAGDIGMADLEAICRLCSGWLRAGGSLAFVIDQLEGIGTTVTSVIGGTATSIPDSLAKGLQKYVLMKKKHGLNDLLLGKVKASEIASDLHQIDHKVNGKNKIMERTTIRIKCPQCNSGNLVFQENCKVCMACGYSTC